MNLSDDLVYHQHIRHNITPTAVDPRESSIKPAATPPAAQTVTPEPQSAPVRDLLRQQLSSSPAVVNTTPSNTTTTNAVASNDKWSDNVC